MYIEISRKTLDHGNLLETPKFPDALKVKLHKKVASHV